MNECLCEEDLMILMNLSVKRIGCNPINDLIKLKQESHKRVK